MGRWGGYARRTVEQTRTIEIGTLRRAGYVGRPASNWWKWRDKAYAAGLWPSHWEDGLIRLPNQIVQTVGISWRFGGQRFYFLCECGRTVGYMHFATDRGAVGTVTNSPTQHDRRCRAIAISSKRRKSVSGLEVV